MKPSKSFGLNDNALNYWRSTGFSAESVRAMANTLDTYLAARFNFMTGSTELEITVSRKVHDTLEGHFPAVVDFVKQVLNSWSDTMPTGSLMVWLEDGIWRTEYQRQAPIFSFGRHIEDTFSLLMPDPAFIDSRGYRDDLLEINEINSSLSWETKKPTVFWRGSGSGVGRFGDWWKEAPRVKLSLISQKLNQPEIFDAAITKTVDCKNTSAQEIHELGLVKPSVPFSEFLKYRYLIDVDGEFCAWKSLFLKLASGSLVIKIGSDSCQWYYDRIQPWVHYVPVLRDLSDLEEIIQWVNTHDKECKEIAANGKELIATMTYENEIRESTRVIQELFRYFR